MQIELKDLLELITASVTLGSAVKSEPKPNDQGCWRVGKNYFIRTVTHHHTGELVAVGTFEIVLRNAAWIADDGRLTQALEKSEFNEVEMFPVDSLVLIGRGSIIDAVEINTIPKSQK